MHPTEYKATCQNPDVFHRLTLEATIRLLRSAEPELAVLLEREMRHPPIPKPIKHEGDRTTDFFHVRIGLEEARAICDACFGKEADAVGDAIGMANYYADLVDLWHNYVAWLDEEA